MNLSRGVVVVIGPVGRRPEAEVVVGGRSPNGLYWGFEVREGRADNERERAFTAGQILAGRVPEGLQVFLPEVFE